MTALYAVGVFGLVFGLLSSIALHELGHLMAARRAGVRVTDYMVGFGPMVWGRQVGETKVGLRLIPLGGYIRMIGMYPAHSRLGSAEHAALDPADRGRVYHSIHPGWKIVIMVAGPAMNLILAVVLLAVAVIGIGVPAPTAVISEIATCAAGQPGCESSPAERMGLRVDDRVVAINGSKVVDWAGLVDGIDRYAASEVRLEVVRDGSNITLDGELGGEAGSGYLGVVPEFEYQRLGVGDLVSAVVGTVVRTVGAVAAFPVRLYELAGVVLGGEPRDPNGPVGVVGLARISGEIADDAIDWRSGVLDVLLLLAGLNVSLFVFNLIPLVPLDGGNAFVALIELVRRRWANWRGAVVPPAIDGARLLPLTYTVAIGLLVMAGLVTIADMIEPLTVR